MRAQEKQRLVKANQQRGVIKFQTRKLLQQANDIRHRAFIEGALGLVEGIKQLIGGFADQ